MRNILVIILLILVGGCDLFRLRDSEEPLKPSVWNEPCITWEQNFENIANAYANFQHWDRYEDQFTEDFRFYFASQDVNDYNINIIWDRTKERDLLYNLHNWYQNMSVEYSNPMENDEIGESQVKIYRRYVLSGYRDGVRYEYSGNLELQFFKENGIWKIRKWYDYRLNQAITWGKLKYDRSL